MAYRVTFIPGDGIGPEVSGAARRCIDATGVEIAWEEKIAGEAAIADYGTPLPEEVLQSIRTNKVALKGPITTPIGKGFRSVNVAFRKSLDLFACVRPCKTYPGVRSKYSGIDITIVRENTEDLYAGIEFNEGEPSTAELISTIQRLNGAKIRHDAAITIKPISIFGAERVIRFAFDLAKRQGRRKVTCIHKANIMKATDGLFLRTFERVAEEYKGQVEAKDCIVDNLCMQLVQRPEHFDVLVLPNIYGDIVSDLCAGLVGGLGVAPGANVGETGALFEPTHGSAPRYAGQNKVNPTATILSGVLMLRHLGEKDAADRLEQAVATVIKEGKSVTYDMKPSRDDASAVGTREMADAIINTMHKLSKVAA